MLHEGYSFDFSSATSVKELESIATQFAQSIGCDYFSYLMTRWPGSKVASKDVVFLSSYPAEWMARYLARTYQFYDPVVSLAQSNRLPYYWGQRGFLRSYNKAERYVFHEAGEFGILEGYSVPIVGPDFDAGIFSIVVDARNQIPDIVEARVGQLQVFATKFHDAVIRLTKIGASDEDDHLTAREREVLTWTAEGYSSEAVAARLGLSASAVNYHVTNCCRKLDAGNKVQAVALAIRLNLI
ncbi:LuxR family transcriptional regulator [Paraburkholderia sp. J8-2]|uniref:helix-turn-helix transcriptional regulator n=1 Tax=Paraburkholderia sp. J8-2 TaxID=2805440 RepID=UPI002AB6A898|nr:LuxR family transcriptional regulator [Paraburkholderia sp. J8-2]